MRVFAAVAYPGGVVIGAAGDDPENLLHEIVPGVWTTGTSLYATRVMSYIRPVVTPPSMASVMASASIVEDRVIIAGGDTLFDENHERVDFAGSFPVLDILEAGFKTCTGLSDARALVRDALHGHAHEQIVETRGGGGGAQQCSTPSRP